MAEYTNDLRLKEIGTGESSGTWGTETNTNLELIAEAFSYGTEASFGSDADATTTIADGATDPARSLYLKITSGVDLTATRTLTIAPNTVSKVWIIENATSGSQSINISQGSGANVTIPNGDVKVVYSDGAGSGAAVVDAFINLKVTDPAQTNITSVGALDGGSITSGFGAIDTGSSNITTTGTVTGNTLAGTLSTAAQTNITSVGTLSSLTVSGDLTVDTSTLKVDSANNRVGIGTASPSAPLDVAGNFIFKSPTNTLYGNFDTTTAGYGAFRLQNQGSNYGFIGQTSSILASGGSNTALGLRSENEFAIATGGSTEKLRIDSSGNVGIGTTSVDQHLHVEGSGTQAIKVETTSDDYAIMQYKTSTSSLWQSFASPSNDYRIGINGVGDALTIDSSFNVGIGTTSPTGKLEISATGTNAAPHIKLVEDSDTREFNIYNDGSGNGRLVLADTDDTPDTEIVLADNGNIQFKTDNTERMLIDSSGNVGIGETSPSQPSSGSTVLHMVSADNNKAASIRLNSLDDSVRVTHYPSTAGYNINMETAHPMLFSTSGSERMRITSTGKVLIGTTSGVRGAEDLSIEASSDAIAVRTASAGLIVRKTSFTNGFLCLFETDAAVTVGSITSNGSTTAYNTSSDGRLKDVTGEARGLEVINDLNPVSYNWKESGQADEGLIAQEVKEIVPNAVSQNEEDEMYQMDYSKLVVHLVKGMKEQQAQIEALQSEINLLKGE